MTENEKIKALVHARLDQAREALESAEMLAEHDYLRGAVNRAYYAIFYCVLALLTTRGLGTSSHTGALTLLSREFVKTELLPRELAAIARRALDRRIAADYSELFQLTPAEVRSIIDEATTFIEQARTLADHLLWESG